eukprot:5518003-Amphidinium_carterae.3
MMLGREGWPMASRKSVSGTCWKGSEGDVVASNVWLRSTAAMRLRLDGMHQNERFVKEETLREVKGRREENVLVDSERRLGGLVPRCQFRKGGRFCIGDLAQIVIVGQDG